MRKRKKMSKTLDSGRFVVVWSAKTLVCIIPVAISVFTAMQTPARKRCSRTKTNIMTRVKV